MSRRHPLPVVLLLAAAAAACSGADSNTTPEAHSGGTLTGNITWKSGQHNVNGTITISNGTLTIAAGSTVNMVTGAGTTTSIIVGKNGGLHVNGTEAKPIIITSSAQAPNRGDWGNIEFQEGSNADSIITNANISFGGGGSSASANGAVVVDAGAAVEISNTVIDNSASFGVAVPGDATLNNFVGNALVHNTAGPVSVTANTAGQLGDGTYGPNDANGIVLIASQLTQNANWINPGTPWIINGLTIQTLSGTAILNVAAGNIFLMQGYKGIIVQKNGALNLAGTADRPITITSANNPSARGDWQDISYYSGSIGAQNAVNYTEIDFAGGNNKGAIWLEAQAKVAITNTTVSNSAGVGITVTAGGQLPKFSGNSLVHNALGAINIDVDDVRQLQNQNNTYAPNTVDGILVSGTHLQTTTAWGPLGAAYVINETFAVDVNTSAGNGLATLTLNPGTTLKFAPSTGMTINQNGQIVSNGTSSNHVLFTVSQEPQEWDTLAIASGNNNSLTYTDFRFYGARAHCAVFLLNGTVQSTFAAATQGQACAYIECPKTASGQLWHGPLGPGSFPAADPNGTIAICPS